MADLVERAATLDDANRLLDTLDSDRLFPSAGHDVRNHEGHLDGIAEVVRILSTISETYRFSPTDIDPKRYRSFLRAVLASVRETDGRVLDLDRKRKKKGSNDDWFNPNDPDAKVTKMKDGRTHLAHKQEHAVDMDTGAVVGVTIQGATEGDTSTIEGTLEAAEENLKGAREHAGDESKQVDEPTEVVADKGYHSKAVMLGLLLAGWRTYIAEPLRGPQTWEDQAAEREAVYANRRRKNGRRGRRLMRRRGELIERSFAHTLETGGMRRSHLRRHDNIAKRLLIHVAGFNLGLLMRKRFGVGKPRCLQGRQAGLWPTLIAFFEALVALMRLPRRTDSRNCTAGLGSHRFGEAPALA